MLCKWLQKKLDASYETPIKTSILARLAEIEKSEDGYRNNMLVLPSRLPDFDESDLSTALEELIRCGRVVRSENLAQFYITDAGREWLKEYNQFCQLNVYGKITWFYKNRLIGLWEIVKVPLTVISIAVVLFSGVMTLLANFDTIKGRVLALTQLIWQA